MNQRLSPEQFGLVLRHPPRRGRLWGERVEYAREVLVDGRRPVDVARDHNVSRQTVSRAANSFYAAAHELTLRPAGRPAAASHKAALPPSEVPVILTVANHKGGVGKTTIAAHLAFRAAEAGRGRVLAVDLDAQANLTATLVSRDDALNVDNAVSLFRGDRRPSVMQTIDPNVDLLPAHPDLTQVDKDALSAAFLARDHLLSFGKEYAAIVIDTAPVLGLRLSASLAASSGVVVPVIPEMYSVDGLAALLAEVQSITKNLNPNLQQPTVVLNLLNPKARQQQLVIAELERMPLKLAKPYLYRHAAVAEATADMRPVWRRSTHAGASAEWRELCDALLSEVWRTDANEVAA